MVFGGAVNMVLAAMYGFEYRHYDAYEDEDEEEEEGEEEEEEEEDPNLLQHQQQFGDGYEHDELGSVCVAAI